jgi:hypothetical protein
VKLLCPLLAARTFPNNARVDWIWLNRDLDAQTKSQIKFAQVFLNLTPPFSAAAKIKSALIEERREILDRAQRWFCHAFLAPCMTDRDCPYTCQGHHSGCAVDATCRSAPSEADVAQKAATLAGDRGAEFDPLDGGRGQ